MEEISKLFQTRSGKTCSLNPLPSFLVKKHAGPNAPVIAILFNKSFDDGVFPEAIKITIIKPLLTKVGFDGLDMKNFWMVSNLSFTSKLLENMVHSRMITHLQASDMMLRNQSEYHRNHSTETAMLKIFNDIIIIINQLI